MGKIRVKRSASRMVVGCAPPVRRATCGNAQGVLTAKIPRRQTVKQCITSVAVKGTGPHAAPAAAIKLTAGNPHPAGEAPAAEGMEVFVGLDVHKDSTVIGAAEAGREAPRFVGTVGPELGPLLKA